MNEFTVNSTSPIDTAESREIEHVTGKPYMSN